MEELERERSVGNFLPFLYCLRSICLLRKKQKYYSLGDRKHMSEKLVFCSVVAVAVAREDIFEAVVESTLQDKAELPTVWKERTT